jgi:signal transduction histidine kinase
MLLEYRTLLAGFLLSLLAVTLGVAYLGWRGSNEAIEELERTRLAHDVLEGLLRVRVDTNRLLTDLTVVALAGGQRGLTEGDAEARLRADIARVRSGIAQEMAMLRSREGPGDDGPGLDQLRRVEAVIDAVVREFEAVASLLAAGQREKAAQRILQAVDKHGEGRGLARDFRAAIQAAIDQEELDVKQADARAIAALTRSAQLTRAASVASLMIAAIGLIVLLKRLRRPLQQLSAVAGNVASGNISSRVAIEGDDEFARVARAINSMLDELQASRAKLELAHSHLEATVAERTAELSALNEALRDVDAVRRRFLADISHELRTPLTIIRGEGEVALRGGTKADDEYRATLTRIVEQADQTARLVNDLLFIARTGADQLRMSERPVPFDELVRAACADALMLGRGQGVTTSFDNRIGQVMVSGDAGRLRQLLHILLDNATRYSDAGTAVQVLLEAADDGVLLRIDDQGRGIPDVDLKYVFERFYRGANAGDREGSGLGLTLAKAIVDAHHGSIELISAARVGTSVRVRLPASREPLAAFATDSDARTQ